MNPKMSFFDKITGAKKVSIQRPKLTQSAQQKIQTNQASIQNPKQEARFIKTNPPKKQENLQIKNMETQNTILPEKRIKDRLPESEGQLVLDVYQNEDEIIIKSTLAGVKTDDVDITITNDMLSIKGAREKDEEVDPKDYYYQECYWGPFSRSVILPTEVEPNEIKASLKNGILTIKMRKSEKIKTKKISVTEE